MIVILNQNALTKNGKSNVNKKVGGTVGNLEKLDVLVPKYGEEKSVMDRYKKLCDMDNKLIKELMEDLALQHYTSDGYKVTRSVQERESMDEELLLTLLKEFPETKVHSIIKTKEYVDFDALEAAIYKDALPKDVLLALDKARTVKYVTTLKVSKVKKKEAE